MGKITFGLNIVIFNLNSDNESFKWHFAKLFVLNFSVVKDQKWKIDELVFHQRWDEFIKGWKNSKKNSNIRSLNRSWF